MLLPRFATPPLAPSPALPALRRATTAPRFCGNTFRNPRVTVRSLGIDCDQKVAQSHGIVKPILWIKELPPFNNPGRAVRRFRGARTEKRRCLMSAAAKKRQETTRWHRAGS